MPVVRASGRYSFQFFSWLLRRVAKACPELVEGTRRPRRKAVLRVAKAAKGAKNSIINSRQDRQDNAKDCDVLRSLIRYSCNPGQDRPRGHAQLVDFTRAAIGGAIINGIYEVHYTLGVEMATHHAATGSLVGGPASISVGQESVGLLSRARSLLVGTVALASGPPDQVAACHFLASWSLELALKSYLAHVHVTKNQI